MGLFGVRVAKCGLFLVPLTNFKDIDESIYCRLAT